MTSDLLETIPSNIRRRLVRELADADEAFPPDLFEGLTSEQRTAILLFNKLLIREIQIEQTRVIVRAGVIVAVLAAIIIADSSVAEMLAQALIKLLGM